MKFTIAKKLGNNIDDEGCEILKEILLENKNIEKIDLSCKLFEITKVNKRSNMFKRIL
jgi:hypothetical protein